MGEEKKEKRDPGGPKERGKGKEKGKGKENKRPCVILWVVGRRWGNLLLAIPVVTCGNGDYVFILMLRLL